MATKAVKPAVPAKTGAIVPATSNVPAVRQQLPAHLQGSVGNKAGFDKADSSDFILPRLGLCQSLSPQRKKADPKFIPGLEEGLFFNSVSSKIYGPKVEVIPLFFAKQRIKFLEPIGSGIDCQAPDGKRGTKYGVCASCQFAQFSKDGDAPECTDFKNLVVLVEGQPLILSYKSTGLKHVKQWMSAMRMLNLPMFACAYEVRAVEETKNTNTFYSAIPVLPGRYTSPEFFQQATDYFNALHEKGVTVDTAGLDQEEGDTSFDTAAM